MIVSDITKQYLEAKLDMDLTSMIIEVLEEIKETLNALQTAEKAQYAQLEKELQKLRYKHEALLVEGELYRQKQVAKQFNNRLDQLHQYRQEIAKEMNEEGRELQLTEASKTAPGVKMLVNKLYSEKNPQKRDIDLYLTIVKYIND